MNVTPISSPPSRRCSRALASGVLGLCILFWAVPAGAATSDAEYARLLPGVWEDHYQGHRTMTIRADGTATMVVVLRGWKAALYASRLQFEMTWSVENGRLKKQTHSGVPAGKVKTILRMMGDRVDEPILELTADRLLLLDGGGKKRYDWRRVRPSTEASP